MIWLVVISIISCLMFGPFGLLLLLPLLLFQKSGQHIAEAAVPKAGDAPVTVVSRGCGATGSIIMLAVFAFVAVIVLMGLGVELELCDETLKWCGGG